MRQENPKKIYQAQQGFVMIIVVSILTVIIALIAIGFSKLSDRELRQASSRESATQAYYAAQSGINDAIAYIKDGGQSFTGCAPTYSGSGPNPTNYFTDDLSSGSNIAKYSCIGVDSTPQSLPHTVTPGKPWIVKIDADNLRNLFIGWESSTDSGSPAWLGSFGSLPNEASFSSDTIGVLRTQIYKVDRSNPLDTNSTLAAGSRAYYLYPDGGSGDIKCNGGPKPDKGCVDYNQGGYTGTGSPNSRNGIFVSGVCKDNSPNPKPDPSGHNLGARTYCNSEIINLNGDISGGNYYYLYFTAQYAPLKVVIQGTDSSGKAVKFTGAQAVIDVTGQSAGQIQRVRATVSLTPQVNEPNYAVQSMETLCKALVMQITDGPHGGNPATYKTALNTTIANQDLANCQPSDIGATGNIQNGGMAGH